MTRLVDVAPELAHLLKRSLLLTAARCAVTEVRCETLMVSMRDGVRLATDLYLPPVVPAPAIAMRSCYGKGMDNFVGAFMSLARRGYVVIVQDCRGTGNSEPESWDYYMYEPEDGYDLVEWVSQQSWFNGFLGACGGSYVGQTQWSMALHPKMSAITPDVSGIGAGINTARLHMIVNAYARSVGKGEQKVSIPFYELEAQMLEETLATGLFNEPLFPALDARMTAKFPALQQLAPWEGQQWLWAYYCSLSCAERAAFVKELFNTDTVTAIEVEALSHYFGQRISHDRHSLPAENLEQLCGSFAAPALLRTGWYDWGLNDALATWELLTRAAKEEVRARCRLFIGPSAHNTLGYHEGIADHPELHHSYSLSSNLEMLLHWNESVRQGRTERWPRVVYYLMGAHEWRAADQWPPLEARASRLYLGEGGALSCEPPSSAAAPDQYTYDPHAPPVTVGGSIVSYVFPPGSVDVSEVQRRPDVLTYTGEPLQEDLDVVGPLRMRLYASSSAVDTDFVVRLSDVFPDGRAIQLQNGILRARYRDLPASPSFLEPGRIYALEIDLWATANRFKVGHRVRVDICSADFPRFDRNSNVGGTAAEPVAAVQRIYHDPAHPSHLTFFVIEPTRIGSTGT